MDIDNLISLIDEVSSGKEKDNICLRNMFAIACIFSRFNMPEASYKALDCLFSRLGWEGNEKYFIALQRCVKERPQELIYEIDPNSELLNVFDRC